MDDKFKKLSDDEILARMSKDTWKLEDIVLFVFGYEHKGVEWKYLLQSGGFPERPYMTALQATNIPNGPKRLGYVDKKDSSEGLAVVYVKKREFFRWASAAWAEDERVKKTYDLWKAREAKKKGKSLALQGNEAIVRAYGNKIQLIQFQEHCSTKDPYKYNANISAISRQAEIEFKGMQLRRSSLKRYITRMGIEELLFAHKNGQNF